MCFSKILKTKKKEGLSFYIWVFVVSCSFLAQGKEAVFFRSTLPPVTVEGLGRQF
jgi:hypothetical protein